MEILGIGPMELVLILIIAMLVFGPDKLPEIGAKLGQSMKAMRKATREFSREIEGARQAVQAPVQELTQPFKEIAQPVQQIGHDIAPLAQAVTNPQEALRQAVTGKLTAPAHAQTAAAHGATATADLETDGAAGEVAPSELTGGPDAVEPAPTAADETAPETPVDDTVWQRAGVKPEKITRRKLDRARRQRWEPGGRAEAPQGAASTASLPDANAGSSWEDLDKAQPGAGAVEPSTDAAAQAADGDMAAPTGPAAAEE